MRRPDRQVGRITLTTDRLRYMTQSGLPFFPLTLNIPSWWWFELSGPAAEARIASTEFAGKPRANIDEIGQTIS